VVRKSEPEKKNPTFSSQEMDNLWRDLVGSDAERAYRAIFALISAPNQTVTFMGERLQNPAKGAAIVPDPHRVARLIGELDDDRSSVRETAMEELEKLGKAAEPALRETLKGLTSAEVSLRVRLLLDHFIENQVEKIYWHRTVEVLEHIGSPEARKLLATVANGKAKPELIEEAKSALARLDKLPRTP
jgi:hypothetical protein